ncbi:MAG: cache domain-containing protein [Oligoflexia bacterium]|nr:cache domain-containing protein [Oligoflexia bacterium]
MLMHLWPWPISQMWTERPRPRHFFLRIIFPAILAMVLFNVTIFFILIPKMKEVIVERKKEMVKELTHAIWSELFNYSQQELHQELSRESAQQEAIKRVQSIRYGDGGKDYFWISDMHARMIMHPYRSDLNNQDLTNFADSSGKRPFVEFANMVAKNGEGYVEYIWQWKDESQKLVNKLSFVKLLHPWGWIIGTGVYLDDVKQEVSNVTQTIIFISFAISLLMAMILFYLVKQGLNIERQRFSFQHDLRRSEERYRLLVESNHEGILLVMNGLPIYANKALLDFLGYSVEELTKLTLNEIITSDQKSLIRRNGTRAPFEMVISSMAQKDSFILTVKNLQNKSKDDEKEAISKLILDFQHLFQTITTVKRPLPPQEESNNSYSSISERSLVFEAIALMQEKNLDQLLVTDEFARTTGILKAADVLLSKHWPLSILINKINTATSIEEIASAHKIIPVFVKAMINNGTKVEATLRVITNLSDIVIRRIIELAIGELAESPPSKFAFVVFGSEARSEQTLYSDQDNGIIFEDDENDPTDYFLRLGELITKNLSKLGQRLCNGKVMANNPKWCKSLSKWELYFKNCVAVSTEQDLHDTSIFFDMRTVYGENSFAEKLKKIFFNLTKDNEIFFLNLANSLLQTKPPIGPFGFQFESAESINIKNALIPLSNLAKLYSLKNKIYEVNTLERLHCLQLAGIISRSGHDELVVAYEILMQLRLKNQMEMFEKSRLPDNLLAVNDLTQLEQTMLKKILSDLAIFRAKAQNVFRGGV